MHQTVSCPLCKSQANWWCKQTDWEYFTTEEYFNYFKCTHCELLFIGLPPVDQLSTIYPPSYYSFVAPDKSIVFKIKEYLDVRLFRKIIKNIPGDSLNILDIGGGGGWLLNNIKHTDKRIASTAIVDIDPQCTDIAAQNGHTYYLSRIETFNTDRKFDLIVLLNLIEHVDNPQQIIQKIGTFLSPKGCVIIKTPNCESWDARLFKKYYWGGLHCPRHWNIFSKKSLHLLTGNSQLEISKLLYTQGAPFWTYSLLVLLKGNRLKKNKRPLINHPLFPFISACFAVFDFIRGAFVPTSQMFVLLKHKRDH